MTAQEYILAELQKLKSPIATEHVDDARLEEAIYAKVMSKKFRKVKADDASIKLAKKAISLAIQESQPLKFNVVFGGNKLWRLDEAPEIDWAEIFSIIYFLNWLKTVASVYNHGALLEYYSQDVVLEDLNNLPRNETDQYSAGFQEMLKWLGPYIPDNVSVNYRRYGDDYRDISAFRVELEEAKKKVLAENGGKLPSLNEAQKIATELNVKTRPGQTDDPLWREKTELIHQAIERTTTVEKYFNDPHYIPVCPTYFPGCIATGSTKKSYAKFWVGVGALEKSGDSFNQIVLTPKQLEIAKFDWEDVNLPGLKGKNFSRIRII